MKMNFGTGLLVGVLLASLLVLGSGGARSPSVFGPALPTGGLVQYTSVGTGTATASSSTTASSAATSPSAISNLSGSVTNTAAGATLQSALGFSSASLFQPPSHLAAIAGNPSEVPILLLPIVLAIALGLAFYLSSRPPE